MKTTFQTTHFAVRISAHPAPLIEVTGELDLASVPIFQAAVRELDLPGRGRVVLDLRQLAFIDAAGVHAVLDLHEASLNVPAALTILPGPRNVQRVFELAGVEQLMPFSRSSTPAATVRPDSGATDSGNETNSIRRRLGGSRDKRGEETQ
jgi:anti-sigma B factor antagonist